MRWDSLTVTATGRVSALLDDVHSIEFHADIDNAGNARFGTSNVTASFGRQLPPGESAQLVFSPEGTVKLDTFYVALGAGGDKVDVTWIAR